MTIYSETSQLYTPVRLPRIELGSPAWQADILPLYYSRFNYQPFYWRLHLQSISVSNGPGLFEAISPLEMKECLQDMKGSGQHSGCDRLNSMVFVRLRSCQTYHSYCKCHCSQNGRCPSLLRHLRHRSTRSGVFVEPPLLSAPGVAWQVVLSAPAFAWHVARFAPGVVWHVVLSFVAFPLNTERLSLDQQARCILCSTTDVAISSCHYTFCMQLGLHILCNCRWHMLCWSKTDISLSVPSKRSALLTICDCRASHT